MTRIARFALVAGMALITAPSMAGDATAKDKGIDDATMVRMVEAKRVRDCASAAMSRRGLDEGAVFALLDKQPDAEALRGNLHRLILADIALNEDGRAKLAQKQSPGDLTVSYMMLSAATFDLGVLTRAMGVEAIHMDRALDSHCNPNTDLLEYTGVPSRANH